MQFFLKFYLEGFKPVENSLLYEWLQYFLSFRHGGALNRAEEEDDLIT